jgi:TATA-binding protein-associated factor
MQYCTPEFSIRVVNDGLLKLLKYQSTENTQRWASRLSALIGLKYWMAVRQDLLSEILCPRKTRGSIDSGPLVDTPSFLAIVEGLKDHNDDVRYYQT